MSVRTSKRRAENADPQFHIVAGATKTIPAGGPLQLELDTRVSTDGCAFTLGVKNRGGAVVDCVCGPRNLTPSPRLPIVDSGGRIVDATVFASKPSLRYQESQKPDGSLKATIISVDHATSPFSQAWVSDAALRNGGYTAIVEWDVGPFGKLKVTKKLEATPSK